MRTRQFPCPDKQCHGELSHEKGACSDCGCRPCAYCDLEATRKWRPAELGGYHVSVCAAHWQAMADERKASLGSTGH